MGDGGAAAALQLAVVDGASTLQEAAAAAGSSGGQRLHYEPLRHPARRILPCQDRPPAYVIPRIRAPLRLIDLRRTLAESSTEGGVWFCDPNASWPAERRWDFHVLSHTWSKELKDFSKRIGAAAQEGASYNEAFKRARLQNVACYQQFVRVLELLRGDGVEFVWYDMLCINQSEEDGRPEGEKAQEIANMASYYRYNLGCYVLMHGVGQGYHLWKPATASHAALWKGSPNSVPRWFSRVWTFQEYVLPPRLIFIVQGLETSTKLHLNHFITKYSKCEPTPIMCSCVATISRCMDVDKYKKECIVLNAAQRQSLEHGQISHPTQHRDAPVEVLGAVASNSSVCHACGTTEPLIRKVMNEDNLYFVNGKALFLVIDLDWGYSGFHQREFFNTLMHLQMLATSYHGGLLGAIVQEIGKRDCERQEDRVLGILGLLQVGGDQQVRTNEKTVEPQLLELPSKLHNHIIIQLCLASKEAGIYNSPGLSWVPNLKCPPPISTLFDLPPIPFPDRFSQAEVIVKKVMPFGRLKLEGIVVQARIMPLPGRPVLSHSHNPLVCYFCRNYKGSPYSSLALHQIRQCQLEVKKNLILPLDVHLFFVHTDNLSVKTCHKIQVSGEHLQGLVEPRDSWYESVRKEDVVNNNLEMLELEEVDEDFESDIDDDLEGDQSCDCAFVMNLPHNICAHCLPSFDVWLLHMARFSSGIIASNPALLICLGNVGTDEGQELHKLGTLTLSDKLWDAAFSNVDHLTEYILGGFEKHHFQKLWTTLAKPPQTCYACDLKQTDKSFFNKINRQLKRI